MDIQEALNVALKFERDWKRILVQTLRERKRVILELQRSQLLAGKDAYLDKLTPIYVADPFFLTPAAAERYKVKKERLASHHSKRQKYNLFGHKDADTPNLIYTGSFHNKLQVEITSDEITFTNSWSKAPNVIRKYPTALGLTDISFAFLWDVYIADDLIEYWNKLTSKYGV